MSESFNEELLQKLGENPFENPEILKTKSGRVVMATDAFFRDHNEDALFSDKEKDCFAVIDGMGGYEKGEEAAKIVAECLEEGLKNNLEPDTVQVLMSKKMRESGIREGGACYVALSLDRKVAKIWHGGDAQAIVFNEKSEVVFETSDVSIGNAPRGNRTGKTTVEFAHLKNYDRILLATDGLWDNVTKEDIVKAVQTVPVDEGLKILARLAREGMTGKNSNGSFGNKDNLTIILYQILPQSLI